jgi:two-component system chemotaxis response regulator CheY
MSQSRQCGEGQQPVVMVIDDNPAIRDMVSWALELDGFDPAEAAEGQEALEWLWNAVSEGRTPAVILLDLAMPGMDGAQFLEQVRERWQRDYSSHPLPAIVVITAGTNGPDAASLGVERIIIKPFHVRDLLDIVRHLVC